MGNLLLINDLKLSEEELQSIEDLSALGYTINQMAMFLEKSPKEFKKSIAGINSEIDFRIKKWKLEADFLINQKMLDNAKSGNITAAQEYKKAQDKIELENIKAKFLYGED